MSEHSSSGLSRASQARLCYREIRGDTGRCAPREATTGATGRYGEIRGDTGRYGEIRGDMGARLAKPRGVLSQVELPGDTREIRGDAGDARLAKPRGVFGRSGAQLAARVIAA